jgi:hypothetical protein
MDPKKILICKPGSSRCAKSSPNCFRRRYQSAHSVGNMEIIMELKKLGFVKLKLKLSILKLMKKTNENRFANTYWETRKEGISLLDAQN